MEKDPLLPFISTRPPPVLCPLPEHDEISLPPPLTPSELKDRLIFGSPADPNPNLYDDFAINRNSPNFTNPNFTNPNFTNPNFTNPSCSTDHNPEQQSLWLSDPSYGFQRNSLHRSKTAPAMAAINDLCHHPSVGKPPKLISSTIIPQACVLLVIYLMFGVTIYWFNTEDFRATETHPVVDALYFCIVTMCTIGYGDITPNSTVTKLFSIMFVLVGFGFIDILLSGMVTYVLDLQESYLLKTNAKVGGNREKDRKSYIIDVKKGRMRIRLKVALALGVVVICIGIGAAVMHFLEDLPWLDSFYLSVMSVTTVGYGDKAFTSMTGRLFASIWLLVSTLAVARAFLYLAEARVDKRHRIMAKWVLGQDMTVSQFLAADIDNNGFVTKSEYVIYKLKEMGKITDKDVLQICRKFEQIDAGNCGKITLADLMGSHL